MRTKCFGGLVAGLLGVVFALAPQLSAQQAAKASADFNGVWLTPGRTQLPNPESEWTSEKLPFTPKGREMFEANKPSRGPRRLTTHLELENDPMREANPPGLYRTLVYSRPVEFIQTPEKVIQMFAWGKVWRSIYTDGRPVPDDVAAGPYWYGYSVGKWEGNTLVITTLALDERAWFDDWGVPISGEARVDERWQPLGPDKLQLTITVRDPVTYSKPWTSSPVIFSRQHNVEPKEIILSPMDEAVFNEHLRIPAATAPK
jgi:hypothetical protein